MAYRLHAQQACLAGLLLRILTCGEHCVPACGFSSFILVWCRGFRSFVFELRFQEPPDAKLSLRRIRLSQLPSFFPQVSSGIRTPRNGAITGMSMSCSLFC